MAGVGEDLMIGGAGNDSYFVDDANDKVTEELRMAESTGLDHGRLHPGGPCREACGVRGRLTIDGNDLNNVL